MSDDQGFAVEALVKHLYGFCYTLTDLQDPAYGPFEDIHVYAVAEKYGVLALKSKAHAKFKNFMMAEKNASMILHFYEIVSLVYSTTRVGDRGLRNVMLEFGRKHHAALGSSSLLEEAQMVMQKHPDFATDFLFGKWPPSAPALVEPPKPVASKQKGKGRKPRTETAAASRRALDYDIPHRHLICDFCGNQTTTNHHSYGDYCDVLLEEEDEDGYCSGRWRWA